MKEGLNNIEHAQGQTHQKGTIATRQALGMQAKYRQKQKKAQHPQAKYACQSESRAEFGRIHGKRLY
jgi:hypothetical protein